MRYSIALQNDYSDKQFAPSRKEANNVGAVLIDIAKGQKKLKEIENDELARCLLAVGQSKCVKSFEHLFNFYVPRLISFMKANKIGQTNADELAQEVMVKVWRKAQMFDPARGSVSAWIFTIARNIRTDAIRAHLRPTFDPTDPIFDNLELLGDQKIIHYEQSQRLNEEIAKLPSEQAELIKLSFFEGLAHTDIANRVGIPIGTVKSRIRLAFAKLRRVLERNKED